MKKFFKCILIVLLCLIVALIPLVINIAFKFDFKIWWLESEWSAGDALSFYGTVLSFIGTISLGIVTIWQTKKSNEISKKLLDKDLLESIDFILIENKIEVNKKENNDSTIIHSTHHRPDYGATVLIEPFDETPLKFNEYLIKLYFKNSSEKSHIKNIEFVDFLCVQDPNKNGLHWEDGSNNPIPQELKTDFSGNKNIHVNWISFNEFYIQLKIYCIPKTTFDCMMSNKVDTCFIFQVKIINHLDIESNILYKIRVSKNDYGQFDVVGTDTSFIDN